MIDSQTENASAGPGELWRRYAGELVRYATVLVGAGDANDVVIEAFLRATRGRDGTSPAPSRSYLYRAVTNQAKNHHRSVGRRRRRDLAAVGPQTSAADDPLIEVRRAVAGLSVRQRAVVFLVYWSDLTEADTATLLGISPGSVRRHLDRAREHLRKALS